MGFGIGEGGGKRLLCGQIFLLHTYTSTKLSTIRRSAIMVAAFPVTAVVNIVENMILYRVILMHTYRHL